MSQETGSGQRSGTPVSGRSTPVSRFHRQNLDESAYLRGYFKTRATTNMEVQDFDPKDKSYRRYAAGVDRALASFETTQQEWADYISFLGRLLKALQTRPAELNVVPDSPTVALRLSQCLTPNLPSGVHQKALEVYGYVFSVLKGDSLAQQLHIYLPGLSSVLSFASLSVRPIFLAIFDGYIASLDFPTIRPALKAIILSLLPGLEDETSEDFDRVLGILDKFRTKVAEPTESKIQGSDWQSQCSLFWQCFFLATITSTSRRQGALAYLSRNLPKFGLQSVRGVDQKVQDNQNVVVKLSPEAEAALSPEPGLLVRCLAVGLSDKQPLVQRGFLDLLVSHLPLHSNVLQTSVPASDLKRLVAAAAGVVSRRDMSLNRRLWTWLLGPDPKAESDTEPRSPDTATHSSALEKAAQQAAYFARYGLHALSESILEMIANASALSAAERSRPFRICLSLMDRWEVGGLLIPEVFVPAMESAYNYTRQVSKEDADELLRSASIFFDGIESALIWTKFFALANDALIKTPQISGGALKLELCDFIVDRFNIREEEMLTIHIPLNALALLVMITSSRAKSTSSETLELAFNIVEKLIQVIPDRAFVIQSKETESRNGTASRKQDDLDALRQVQDFYGDNQGSLEAKAAPIPSQRLGQAIFAQASAVFQASINSHSAHQIDHSTKVLVSIIGKLSANSIPPEATDLITFLMSMIDSPSDPSEGNFAISSSVTAILVALQSKLSGFTSLLPSQISRFQQILAKRLWPHLSPSLPKFHVEAVRCLAFLDSLSEHRGVEACVASLIQISCQQVNETPECSPFEAGQRFGILWTHLTQDKSFTLEKGQKSILRRGSGPYGLVATSPAFVDPTIILTRPLLILLESLADEGADLSLFTRTWIQEVPGLNGVFDLLIKNVSSLHTFQNLRLSSEKPTPNTSIRAKHSTDIRELVYYLKLLLNILRFASEHTWRTLASETASAILPESEEESKDVVLQKLISQICLSSLNALSTEYVETKPDVEELHYVSMDILNVLIGGPFSAPLKELDLDEDLLQRLHRSVGSMEPMLQVSLLQTITAALKLKLGQSAPPAFHTRTSTWRASRQGSSSNVKTSFSKEDPESDSANTPREAPPPVLIECLKAGFSSPTIHPIIENWVSFLVEVLPLLTESIFQHMIPLVECFCYQISFVLGQLKSIFSGQFAGADASPETTLIGLMNGVEQILAKAHERLVNDETKSAANPKSPDLPQSFIGSVVQGVFAGENQQQMRSSAANSRLTVLLCFQDTIRSCFTVWCWGLYGSGTDHPAVTASATFSYTSLRMRNRARRLLDHLFAAEALECLETLIVLWSRPPSADFQCESIIGLLNVLSSSRPKRTVPAIFNAIYSRTNPSALDPSRMSSLTSDLSETELVAFLVEYISSIEDDAMDEIWTDCMTFLRDILSNPMPQRQILPMLLEFTTLLAEKLENTNFGDQRRMRRELGVSLLRKWPFVLETHIYPIQDLFLRMLTATFTTRPQGSLQDPIVTPTSPHKSAVMIAQAGDFLGILTSVMPKLQLVLADGDRIGNAANSISSNVIAPAFKARVFPTNIDIRFLNVLYQMTRVSQAGKFWRKDVSDALNDARFFNTELDLVRQRWMPIFRQLTMNDKERMPELVSRLSAPTTAGVVFGVGATSARMEADRKTQANLRRIVLIILSSPLDTFVTDLGKLHEKIAELFNAKSVSAPSSAILAEVFTVIRAIVLRTSSIHLAPMWPTINSELQKAILSVLPANNNDDKYNNAAILGACKLLDVLVTLEPDDFQLQEWLFVTDTIDAVYKPAAWEPTALADDVAEALASVEMENNPSATHSHQFSGAENAHGGRRRPLLDTILQGLGDDVDVSDLRSLPKAELASRVLRPFLGQLSMTSFEETYGLFEPDIEACVSGVLANIFDGSIGGEV